MSRGLDIEIDDERGRAFPRDHREETRERPAEKPLPKEARVWRLDRHSIPVERELPTPDLRDAVNIQDSEYRLRQTEVDSLRDLGRFRLVEESDLQRFGYADDDVRMREDVRSLREQGLIERRSVALDDGEYLSVFALTARGRQVTEALEPAGSKQHYYDGFVKTSEAQHDAALFRMFQAEESKIRQSGGVVKRVVLDFELKRDAYSYLGKQDRNDIEGYREQQEIAAAAYRLEVVRGHIQFPDLRIEYEDAQGYSGRVDLELTTPHYKKGQIAAKAAAGFKLYSLGGDSSGGGSAVREERGLTSEILSL